MQIFVYVFSLFIIVFEYYMYNIFTFRVVCRDTNNSFLTVIV